MSVVAWMALSVAHATPQLYIGSGVSVTTREKRLRVSWLLEAEVRELIYRPAVTPSDLGHRGRNYVEQRFVTGDIGGFLQARIGGSASIAGGALAGVTRAYHRQAWGQPNGDHTGIVQATLEVGASLGKANSGLHVGAAAAGQTGEPISPMVGGRGRVVWNRNEMSPLEVDLLVRGNLRPRDVCLWGCFVI